MNTSISKLPSLFPITREAVQHHLSFLGYKNLPPEIIEEFTAELERLEGQMTAADPLTSRASSQSPGDRDREAEELLEKYQIHETALEERGRGRGKMGDGGKLEIRPASAMGIMTTSSPPAIKAPSKRPSSVTPHHHSNNGRRVGSGPVVVCAKPKKTDPVSLFKFHSQDWKKQPYVRLHLQKKIAFG